MGETVQLTQREGVATVTLNRPQVFNAFNQAMSDELLKNLKQLRKDSAVRCVVLTGAGKAFCSGQDLGDRKVSEGEVLSLGESVRIATTCW